MNAIHQVTPLMGQTPPESLRITPKPLPGVPEYATLDRSPQAVWQWLQRTPVWPRLTEGVEEIGAAELCSAGHAAGWSYGDTVLPLGLPVVVKFSAPHEWHAERQSWSVRYLTVAVNEDGTRGVIVADEISLGADNRAELAAEALAWREGGGIPDAD